MTRRGRWTGWVNVTQASVGRRALVVGPPPDGSDWRGRSVTVIGPTPYEGASRAWPKSFDKWRWKPGTVREDLRDKVAVEPAGHEASKGQRHQTLLVFSKEHIALRGGLNAPSADTTDWRGVPGVVLHAPAEGEVTLKLLVKQARCMQGRHLQKHEWVDLRCITRIRGVDPLSLKRPSSRQEMEERMEHPVRKFIKKG